MSITTEAPAWKIALDQAVATKAATNRKFWDLVCDGLAMIEATKPDTFEGIHAILAAHHEGTYSAPSNREDHEHFPGSGGDDDLLSSLEEAGWEVTWMNASYYYVARHPRTNEHLTYIEGDVYRGDVAMRD